MAKYTRKGRNPGPVDQWLDTLGYYRKNVAYDETCLFRAVSEQLYCSQMFHESIRKNCIDYAKANHAEILQMMPKKFDLSFYLEQLSRHMAVCGNIELQIISKMYNKGILMFDGINRSMIQLTTKSYPSNLMLCRMGNDHYDVIHEQEYIQDSGFCQSIVYNILYEGVFGIEKVENIVQTMLYQKVPFIPNAVEHTSDHVTGKYSDDNVRHLNDYDYMLKTNIAPFPFKVAKALDPTIYRNIEYDTWTEMRKEMRLGDWYYGDKNLVKGSGCILNENGVDLHCYIQEVSKEDGWCSIYITKLAEKRTVRLSELQPEEGAKPWPLPYRFSKNLISMPRIEINESKGLRRRRIKKLSVSKCSNDSESQVENVDGNFSAFEGVPLQMHTDINGNEQDTAEIVAQQEETRLDSNEPTWEANVPVLQTSEPAVWSQPQTVPQNVLAFSPGVVLATTPQVYPEQLYYHPDQTYPRCNNPWMNVSCVTPLPAVNQMLSPFTMMEVPQSPDMFNYFLGDLNYPGAPYFNVNTPPGPQVELYPPVYSSPVPTTPAILPSPEITDVVLPTPPPHVVYSPVEVPYVTSSPYVYPPTPTAPWYHMPINSQGFMFPPGPNTSYFE